MIVGHSMGGMLAARFATQFPGTTERLVLYNPIGLTDPRYGRPWESADEGYKRTLASTYQTIRASIMRYVAHNEAAWTPEFETYTRVRYAWTLSADWPRLAMVQTLINQVQYLDPVVDDWAHIKAPTLVFGGAEDTLPGSAARLPRADEVRRRHHSERQRAGCSCCPASDTCRTWKRPRRRSRRSSRSSRKGSRAAENPGQRPGSVPITGSNPFCSTRHWSLTGRFPGCTVAP